MTRLFLTLFSATLVAFSAVADETRVPREFTNSLGMKFTCIDPGSFEMGSADGNVEEWCYYTYEPYPADSQTDPVGRAAGEMKEKD